MSRAGRAVRRLLDEAEDLPPDARQHELLGRAIALADEAGDTRAGYRARLRLIANCYHVGDNEAMLTAFAWCVAMNERDPRRHPAVLEDDDLHWYHKWMPPALAAHPGIPRSDVEAALQHLDATYREAGLGRSGALQTELEVRLQMGDLEGAGRARAELAHTPDDDYSDCEACVAVAEVDFQLASGDEESALAAYDRLVDQQLECSSQPEEVMARMLLPLLRAGRHDDAVRAHLMSYRLVRGNPESVGVIGPHLTFCAATGNEARGLTILQRHLAWLAHDRLEQRDHLAFLQGAGALLDAVARAGEGGRVVGAAADRRLAPILPPPSDGTWTVDLLGAACWKRAEEIAAAFDRRNGTAAATRELTEVRRTGVLVDLPVGGESFAMRAPASSDVATSGEEPDDAAGWEARAFALAAVGDPEGALVAAARGLDLVGSGSDPGPGDTRTTATLTGLRHQLLVALAASTGASTGASAEACADALAERVAALRADGREEQADLEERLGSRLFAPDDDGRAALVEAARQAASPHLRAQLRVAAAAGAATAASAAPSAAEARERWHTALTEAEAARSDLADAAGATDAALLDDLGTVARVIRADARLALAEPGAEADALALWAELAQGSDLAHRVTALQSRARHFLHLADHSGDTAVAERALDDAETALTLVHRLGSSLATARAASFLAQALARTGRVEAAAARALHALREARRAAADVPADLRLAAADLLVDTGRPDEAADELLGLVDDLAARGAAADELAPTFVALGHAQRNAGAHEEAHAAYAQAIAAFDRCDDPIGGALAGRADALLLSDDGDDRAVAAADEALERARRSEDPRLVAVLTHTAGHVRGTLGAPDALHLLDDAAHLAATAGLDELVADVLDSTVDALVALGRTREVVPAALRAADAYVRTDNPVGAAVNETVAALALHEEGRSVEAVPLLESARERVLGHPFHAARVGFALGDVLEDLRRHPEALEARRRAEEAAALL